MRLICSLSSNIFIMIIILFRIYFVKLAEICELKATGQKFSAIACYDYITASILNQSQVDMALVGDSVSQAMLGHSDTLDVTMDFMVEVTAAVSRGATDRCVVADMPAKGYKNGIPGIIENAKRFIAHGNADIVKIEADSLQVDIIKSVKDAGIPVMPHIGIRPQSGLLKAQGVTPQQANDIIKLAIAMESAGADMLLLEGVACEVAKLITESIAIPVIGCGSGVHCDGDVLLACDILGLTTGKMPKFSCSFAHFRGKIQQAFDDYATQVKNRTFPDDEHSYHIKKL